MDYAKVQMWVLWFMVVVAVVLAAVALYYALNGSSSSSSSGSAKKGNGDKCIIPFSSGRSADTIAGQAAIANVGTGDKGLSLGFGSFFLGSATGDANNVQMAESFVIPYDCYASNLHVQFAGISATGTTHPWAATLYKSPSACTAVCGAALAATKLFVASEVTDVVTDVLSSYCKRNKCDHVKLCRGDRVSLVFEAGSLWADVVELTNLSAGLQLTAC